MTNKPKIAIVGLFQVGKSTLVNCLNRKVVAATGDGLPTTHKSNEYELENYTLVDTPGFDANSADTREAKVAVATAQHVVFVIENKGLGNNDITRICEIARRGIGFSVLMNCRNGSAAGGNPYAPNNETIAREIDARLEFAGIKHLCSLIAGGTKTYPCNLLNAEIGFTDREMGRTKEPRETYATASCIEPFFVFMDKLVKKLGKNPSPVPAPPTKPPAPSEKTAECYDKHKDLEKTAECYNKHKDLLGKPLHDEQDCARKGGRYRSFQNGLLNGQIHWSKETGAHETHGMINDLWGKTGWESGLLGYPTSDESDCESADGRVSHFENGKIIWSKKADACTFLLNEISNPKTKKTHRFDFSDEKKLLDKISRTLVIGDSWASAWESDTALQRGWPVYLGIPERFRIGVNGTKTECWEENRGGFCKRAISHLDEVDTVICSLLGNDYMGKIRDIVEKPYNILTLATQLNSLFSGESFAQSIETYKRLLKRFRRKRVILLTYSNIFMNIPFIGDNVGRDLVNLLNDGVRDAAKDAAKDFSNVEIFDTDEVLDKSDFLEGIAVDFIHHKQSGHVKLATALAERIVEESFLDRFKSKPPPPNILSIDIGGTRIKSAIIPEDVSLKKLSDIKIHVMPTLGWTQHNGKELVNLNNAFSPAYYWAKIKQKEYEKIAVCTGAVDIPNIENDFFDISKMYCSWLNDTHAHIVGFCFLDKLKNETKLPTPETLLVALGTGVALGVCALSRAGERDVMRCIEIPVSNVQEKVGKKFFDDVRENHKDWSYELIRENFTQNLISICAEILPKLNNQLGSDIKQIVLAGGNANHVSIDAMKESLSDICPEIKKVTDYTNEIDAALLPLLAPCYDKNLYTTETIKI